MQENLKLVLDQSVLDRYNEYYFRKYPKRKRPPIERPIHESINRWMIMQRPQMNDLKQRWKEFVMWWIDDLGLQDLQLDQFELTFVSYFPSRRRADPDNYVPKFILDGFTEAGFIVDDSGDHLKKLCLATAYDKENPRTEIYVRTVQGE